MTTVVNNPGGVDGDNSGVGVVLGVLLAIVIIVLFFVYGLPAIRSNPAAPSGGTNINVTLPPTPAPSPSPTPVIP